MLGCRLSPNGNDYFNGGIVGHFDSVDVQDALAKKKAHEESNAKALAVFEEQSRQFIETELPQILSEFVAKAAALVPPEDLPGLNVQGWALGNIEQNMHDDSLHYCVDSDRRLYFQERRASPPVYRQVEGEHILHSLYDVGKPGYKEARLLTPAVGQMRSYLLKKLLKQLELLASPGSRALYFMF
jgi:hypothetical protein